MDALLAEVLNRHGGLERWSSFSTATATMSIGGLIWAIKGWPDALTRETVEIDTRTERSVFTPFHRARVAVGFRAWARARHHSNRLG